jgi:hypothetical protein
MQISRLPGRWFDWIVSELHFVEIRTPLLPRPESEPGFVLN